jgi:exopolysaccharide biosynthesis polyprenyl glycosylphosphotransferase
VTTYDVALGEEVLESLDARTVEILKHRRGGLKTKRRGALVRRSLLSADLVGLTLAFVLAQQIFAGHDGADHLSRFTELALFLVSLPGWVVAAKVYGLYDKDEERTDHSTTDDFAGVFHLIIVCTVLLYAGFRITGIAEPYFSKLSTFSALAIVVVTAGRSVARAICRRQIGYLQNAVIVGAGEVGQSVARKLVSHHEYGINVVGFVDADPKERREELAHVSILGDIADLPVLIRLLDVERVIIAFSNDSSEELLRLINEIRPLDVQIDIVPRLFAGLGPSVSIHAVEGIPLLGLPPVNLSRSSLIVKRAVDVALAATGLLVLAPFFALIALLIKLDARGPVFYRHERVGRGGQPFRLFKFRTMYLDACRGAGYGGESAEDAFAQLMTDPLRKQEFETTYKLQEDPRVTRLGGLLRRTSIDELPQLINVVLGDISLVGPRPVTADELHRYGDRVGGLLNLRPGVTGYWQINGRSSLDYEDRVRLDMAYVGGWSLRLDLEILVKTVRVVFASRSAY